jgi:hypothetical protein
LKSYASFLIETFDKIDHWKHVNDHQLGSNPGGLMKSPEGENHYVKFYKNPEQAKTEHATGRIYNQMGIHTPQTKLISHGGRLGIASKWNDSLERVHAGDEHNYNSHNAAQMGRLYHAAVLTKNWDVVGLEHDNVMRDKHTGDIHSIDHGGSMNFRAMGTSKPFDHDISEHKTLKDPSGASTAGVVFSNVFKKHPDIEKKTSESLKNLSHEGVQGILKDSGIADHANMASTIMKRRDAILKKYD